MKYGRRECRYYKDLREGEGYYVCVHEGDGIVGIEVANTLIGAFSAVGKYIIGNGDIGSYVLIHHFMPGGEIVSVPNFPDFISASFMADEIVELKNDILNK